MAAQRRLTPSRFIGGREGMIVSNVRWRLMLAIDSGALCHRSYRRARA